VRRSDSSSSLSPGTVKRSPTVGMSRSDSRGGAGNGHFKTASSGSPSPSPTTSRAPGMSRTLSAASVSSASSSRSAGSHTRSRAMSRSNSGSASSRPSPYPSTSSTSTSRTRPSTLLSRASPSLASPSAFTISHSNLSSVGLSFTPPLASPAGLRGFAKGLSGLPSPPHTASDAGSSRYGTTRSNGTDLTSATGSSDGSSPAKPQRPPKSEARRGSLGTPPRQRALPAIGRTSPTVVGSPAPSRRELDSSSAVVSASRRSARDVFEGEAREADSSGDVSIASSTTPTRETNGGGELEPTRRLRARTFSGDEEADEDVEKRKERRSRNGAAVRQKNQKVRCPLFFAFPLAPSSPAVLQILDSINSQLSHSSSSSSLDRPTSSCNPISTLRRSSTFSTIREIAEGSSSASSSAFDREHDYPSTSRNNNGGTWLDENRDTRHLSQEPDEFGVGGDGVHRSSTLNDLSGDTGRIDRDSPLHSQTQGYRHSGRNSIDNGAENTIPLRSSTSMSFHPTSPEQRQRSIRRSDLVGSERTRSASAFGGTEDRDAAFAASMKRLASPRERTQSEVSRTTFEGEGEEDLPDSPAASMRNRPALPREFRTSPSANGTPSRFASRPSLDVGRNDDLSPSLAQNRTTSPRISTSSTSALAPRDRLSSPQVSSPRTKSALSTPDPAERRRYSRSTGLDGSERESTPRSGKKSSNGSGEGGRYGESASDARRTQSISEIIERPYSRQSRNGPSPLFLSSSFYSLTLLDYRRFPKSWSRLQRDSYATALVFSLQRHRCGSSGSQGSPPFS
jgi:hypothetical protein